MTDVGLPALVECLCFVCRCRQQPQIRDWCGLCWLTGRRQWLAPAYSAGEARRRFSVAFIGSALAWVTHVRAVVVVGQAEESREQNWCKSHAKGTMSPWLCGDYASSLSSRQSHHRHHQPPLLFIWFIIASYYTQQRSSFFQLFFYSFFNVSLCRSLSSTYNVANMHRHGVRQIGGHIEHILNWNAKCKKLTV